jgi:RNA polymerase sigma factor (sigma-70 family)
MSNPGSLLQFIRRMAAVRREGVSDGQLLEQFAQSRDEASFTALVVRHGPMVFGVCRRVLRNQHDAEDAFQAALLVLARKAGSIRQPELLGNWLFGVAYRTALEARTKVWRRRAREKNLKEECAAEPTTDFLSSELRAVLDDEVKRLPARYRTPFVLCYMEGQTNEEAARKLGCAKGTVLSRLAWARQRLRNRLARRGVTLSAAAASGALTVDSLSAAVPAELVRSTARLAGLFVAGQAAGSIDAINLAKGVLTAMVIDKCKRASVVLLTVLLFGGGLARLGQLTRASDQGNPAPAAAGAKSEPLVETLISLEKGNWEATKKKDVKRLRQLCAEDFVAIISDGSRLSLDEYCDCLPLFEVKSYVMSEVRMLSLGLDAAILTYKTTSETVILGETEKEQVQVSSTWVCRDGEWRNILYQETSIED